MASSPGNTGRYGSTVSCGTGRQPTPELGTNSNTGTTHSNFNSKAKFNKAQAKSRKRMGDDGLWIHSEDDVSFSGSDDLSSKRGSKRWYHDVADFANLLKSFVGTNYLALAYGIKLAGLGLGIGGLIVISLLTAHCCHLIVKVKYHAIRKVILKRCSQANSQATFGSSVPGLESPEEIAMFQKLQRTMSYADIGRTAYGPWGARFVLIFLVITQMGFCVNYHIFIGSNIYSLINPVEVNSSVPSPSGLEVVEQFDLPRQSLAVFANGSREDPAAGLYSTSPSWIPPLELLVLIPLPIFIGFTLFRDIRVMGFVSLLANGMMSAGYFVVVAYIISTFSLADDLKWFEWSTFPVFLGQAASSYEAIGTILSIEASMDGNHKRYPVCLYTVMTVFSSMLTLSAILGYLKYGEVTAQILVQNLPQTGALIITVNTALIIAIFFTYPLQVYPVIEILEGALFTKGAVFGPKHGSPLADSSAEESQPLLEDDIGKVVPDSVATWKRNFFRVSIAVVIAGLAVVFRNDFAYVNAFVGAIGSCPLAFILPCLFHLKICGFRLKRVVIIKDLIIIVIGTLITVISLTVVVYQIIGSVSF